MSYSLHTSLPPRTVFFSLSAASAYLLNKASPRLSVRENDASSSSRISFSSAVFLVTSGKMSDWNHASAMQESSGMAHQGVDDGRDEGREEASGLGPKLVTGISHASSQNTPQDVSSSILVRNTTI